MKDLSNKFVVHQKKDGIEFLQFRKLLEYDNILIHGYSLRSNYGNFKTKGVNVTKETREEAIENYKRFTYALQMESGKVIKPDQKHTDKVEIVEEKNKQEVVTFEDNSYPETDGLITNEKGIVVATTNADCILLLFFDPVKKVIANVHSGWKGSLQQISVKTIDKMVQTYHSNPKDILCCMTPSIRKCHFVVKQDVKTLFAEQFPNKKEDIIEEIKKEEQWVIDTIKLNRILLQEKGLRTENIIDSQLCSVCHSNQIHSYRVDKQQYQLATAMIALR